MKVIIQVDDVRRMILHKEGGLELETKINGVGWCLDNDTDVSDSVIVGHLETARRLIVAQVDKLTTPAF